MLNKTLVERTLKHVPMGFVHIFSVLLAWLIAVAMLFGVNDLTRTELLAPLTSGRGISFGALLMAGPLGFLPEQWLARRAAHRKGRPVTGQIRPSMRKRFESGSSLAGTYAPLGT